MLYNYYTGVDQGTKRRVVWCGLAALWVISALMLAGKYMLSNYTLSSPSNLQSITRIQTEGATAPASPTVAGQTLESLDTVPTNPTAANETTASTPVEAGQIASAPNAISNQNTEAAFLQGSDTPLPVGGMGAEEPAATEPSSSTSDVNTLDVVPENTTDNTELPVMTASPENADVEVMSK